MNTTWAVTIGSTTRTWAGWNLSDVQRTRVSLGLDTVTADRPVSRWDVPTDIAVGQDVAITRDGTPWFRGRVDQLVGQGGGGSQRTGVVVAGPWWWLEHIPYMQYWRVWKSTALGYDPSGRVLLGWSGSGWMTTGEQVRAIVNWAIARGAPIQLGTVADGIKIPIDEVHDLFCSEAIRRMLRIHPDWVGWFDYSTNPPTFHAGPRSGLTAKSVALTDGWSAPEVRPRYDLRVPSVRICFERTASNGKREFVIEVAPSGATGLEPGVLPGTIMLESPQSGGQSVTLDTEDIEANHADAATRVAWWKRWWPGLNDPALTSITITDVKVDGADPTDSLAVMPRALIEGQISDAVTPQFVAEKQTWTAKAAVVYAGNAATVQMQVELTATDAVAGDYDSGGGDEEGEPYSQFAGLAANVYASCGTLHYEGSVSRVGQSVLASADDIRPGHVLNITGTDQAALASMNALVQSVTEALPGRTSIRFGPPGHLGPTDMVEYVRSFRQRSRSTPRAWQDSGGIAATRPPASGGLFGTGNSSAGLPTYGKLEMVSGAGATVKTVQVDPSLLPAGKTAKFREVAVCEDGVQKKVMMLCTETYT